MGSKFAVLLIALVMTLLKRTHRAASEGGKNHGTMCLEENPFPAAPPRPLCPPCPLPSSAHTALTRPAADTDEISFPFTAYCIQTMLPRGDSTLWGHEVGIQGVSVFVAPGAAEKRLVKR
ncbi:hypothetical protein H920_00112 [Fukomys damarensis]|uniref:Secreted protein n=1 Tax=Fukomys damarensis TaxID=885580 RepID=A0A091E6R1_FUKDA|nr:hypothetical protein H920_00112 [Fukomys damarensis]